MTTRSVIEKFIAKHPDALDVLDDLVHEQASQLASAVNNNGIKSQLEFLMDHRGIDCKEVLQHLEEAVAP